MKRVFPKFLPAFVTALFLSIAVTVTVHAQETGATSAPPPPPPADTAAQTAHQTAVTTQAAAAYAGGYLNVGMPNVIEELADSVLTLLNIHTTGNSWQRLVLAACVVAFFYLLRRIVLPIIFHILRKGARRTHWVLAEHIVTAIEKPAALFLVLMGIYVAVRTLVHPPEVDKVINGSATLFFALTFFWLLLRVLNTFLEFIHLKAKQHESPIAAFMPWIRKALVTIFVVVGGLTIADAMGLPVQTFLAGLGIGGLALALAAQDTVANVFGAAVVAVDQPFKIGETVQLAGHLGTVEDIGIRSMKLRRPDKALVVIPNKTVAAESIINLSKFTNRRIEQVIGFTYDSTPDQLSAIVEDFRGLLTAEAEIDPTSVMVYFRDFSASSLDLWVVYITKDPDFHAQMRLRQRLNLSFMRAAAARGLSFAFPTQTLDLGNSALKALAARKQN